MKIINRDNIIDALPKIFIAGVAGTAIMTLFVNSISKKSNSNLKVVRILGTMLTDQAGNSGRVKNNPGTISIGTFAHYSVGVGFALSYLVLYRFRIVKFNLTNSITWGFLSGIIGISIWYSFFKLHPRPTNTPLSKYLALILLSHVVFGIGAIETYRLFYSENGPSDKLLPPISENMEPKETVISL